jgi:hypothetical protein
MQNPFFEKFFQGAEKNSGSALLYHRFRQEIKHSTKSRHIRLDADGFSAYRSSNFLLGEEIIPLPSCG